VNWFRHVGIGFHSGEWLASAIVILLALVPGIALLKLVIWLLTPERDRDESGNDYWRRHG
jgi:predicted nucleotidyltransferase